MYSEVQQATVWKNGCSDHSLASIDVFLEPYTVKCSFTKIRDNTAAALSTTLDLILKPTQTMSYQDA